LLAEYYLHLDSDGNSRGTWRITDTEAIRVGVPNAKAETNTYVLANDDEDIHVAISRLLPQWFGDNGADKLEKIVRCPQEYYPRIARPDASYPKESPGNCPGAKAIQSEIASTKAQLSRLTQQLERICQTVQPTSDNFNAFGHDIRNLLILSCTEIEAQWRGILVANGLEKNRYTTKDYVKIAAPMKLQEYSVSFPHYPWIEPVAPFSNWGKTDSTTQDLDWYDAYNAVKHNREGEFKRATLNTLFNSLAACAIIICAQFGKREAFGLHNLVSEFYNFSSVPKWLPSDVYIRHHVYDSLNEPHQVSWSSINFPFNE